MARPTLIAFAGSALLLGAGCGRTEPFAREIQGPVEIPATARRDLNFTGLWLVDQPYHALYEATYYNFRPTGELLQGLSIGVDGHLQEHGETGSVARPSGEPSCTFGDTWWNLDAFTVVILGTCSDQVFREISMRFERSPGLGVDLGETEQTCK